MRLRFASEIRLSVQTLPGRLAAAAIALAAFSVASVHAQLPAFPGAQGFGRFATGARGGTVYHVTNTNDSGPGSFRDAVSVSGRTVVFDVGGIIDYQPPRYAPKPNVTIAGQTAPGDGVTLYGNGLSFSDANNAICRFLRVRQGINGDSGTDAITIASGHDMIFDHVSVSWGRDETFSVSGNITNITIQSTIISQGLQTHSAGGLIQASGGVSILRCFYIDNDTRNPKVKFINEYVNNVIYAWDSFAYNMGGDSAGDSYVNAFNNYFVNGPMGGSPAFSGGNANFHIFATNNWQDSNLNGVLDGAIIPLAAYGPMDAQAAPFAYPITVDSALPPLTALKLVISDAGTSWKRDQVDERMFTELTSWGLLGETVNSEFEAPMNGPGIVRNGTPYTDTDQDGMPDFWELGTGSDPGVANNNDPSPSGSGYTRLEDYLNWLTDPHGIALTNSTVCVELRQFTRGFTNSSPIYSVSNPTNGTVTLVSGHIALFTPNTDFVGPAGFTFSVVDADGSTLTRPMNLFFTPLAQPFNPIWRGDDAANNWNVSGDFNWFNGQSLLFPFHNGDSVSFDDTGSANPAVNLVGSLQPALVTINAAQNYTFAGSGSLDGSMALNKAGTGTLTLAGTNNFSGPATVSNGVLLINGSLPQSAVTVLSGAIVGGNGSLGFAPALQSGANLAPGNGVGAAGTLTINNSLTESGGIINRFDLTDDPTGTMKTNDQINVIGDLNLSGANTIQVNLLNGPLANGDYTLITFTGSLNGSLSNLSLLGANGTLILLPGAIGLHVDNTRPPASLVWLGTIPGSIWDAGTNANWLNGATQDRFYFGDDVLFDDSGSAVSPITLSGALSPASVTVNATKNYTFSGTGKITGTTGITKTNTGTLTVSTANDYTGVTAINGGVLSIAQLGNGTVAGGIGAAGTNAASLVLNGGTLRYTGSSAGTDRAMTLNSAGGTLDVSSAATTLTWNNPIIGGGQLTKLGPGRVDVAVAGSYSGGTIVNAGTVRLVSDTGLGSGAITLNGTTNSATFRFGSDGQTLGNALNVVGTNNFSMNAGNDTVSDMTGNGTLHIVTNAGTVWTMAGNMSGFSGTIVADAIQNVRFNPSTGSANATFDLSTGTILLNNRNGGLTIHLGALIGGPNVTLQGASSANSLTTYVIGEKNLNTTFAGKITEVIPARTAAITKAGTGTFTLTGASTHTGPTIINGGTLLVNNTTGSGTGTNSVTVNSSGTLGGTGFIYGPVIVNSGGAISPGSNGVGQLTLKSNLTLNAGCTLTFELGAIAASDRLVVSNALVLNGALSITNVAGFGPGTYSLINYGGALSGSMPVIGGKPAGFSCDVNTNTAGQVRLVVQAQVPPVINNVSAGGGLLTVSGSSSLTNTTYFVMASTNLALPANQWLRIATNNFGPAGSFTFSNAIDPLQPQQFFRVQLP
jgi:autotransporter-associated beta strand protein